MNDHSDSLLSESITQYEFDFSDEIRLNSMLIQHFEFLFRNSWLIHHLKVPPSIAREQDIPHLIEALIENNVIDDLKLLCGRTYAAVIQSNCQREPQRVEIGESG